MRPKWLGLVLSICIWSVFFSPFQARAQVVDGIELVPTSQTIEIHIKFNTPIVYQFHTPDKKQADLIQLHLILPKMNPTLKLRRELNTSPPNDILPRFKTTFPDQEKGPTKSLSIRFDRPVPFEVLGAKGRFTLVLAIPIGQEQSLARLSPARPKESRTPEQLGLPSEQDTQDTLKGKKRVLDPRPLPSPPREFPSRQEVQDLQQRQRKVPSENSLLDRIEIIPKDSTSEIHILFKTPVRYLYHFPLEPGNYVRVHLVFPRVPQALGGNIDQWDSPSSDLVSPFTIAFPDQETAITKRLSVTFSESLVFRVRGRKDRKGIIISVPRKNLPLEVTQEPPAIEQGPPMAIPQPSPGQDFQQSADTLMTEGRAALTAGDNEKATQLFNALLILPPNAHSQQAQELVGLARERNGELKKARIEYEVYLKVYPNSEGASRVRQRLASLPQTLPTMSKMKPLKRKRVRQIKDTSVYGNLSQYYYGGHSRFETTIVDGGVVTRTNQNTTDQSSLVSTINLTGRQRYNQFDTKVIFRGSDTMDFLEDEESKNSQRLRRAYLQHENDSLEYMVLVGRQPGNSGGVLGTFDGGWFRYDVFPEIGLNLVGGFPESSNFNDGIQLDSSRKFWGTNVDLRPADANWSGNTYFINQMVDGILDRQALGGELRYFENGRSVFSLLDFDISYGVLNIAMLNGSWLTDGGTTFTLLVDHRKTPSMQTGNALIGSGTTSVKDALRSVSEKELRRQAKALTAETDLVLLGMTYPLSSTWQIGGDLRFNHTTETEAVGSQPGIPASGNIWTYTGQAIGTDLFFQNHTLTISGGYINTPDFQGQSLVLTSLARFGTQWQVDSSVNFYHQKDQNGVRLIRVSPVFRMSYRWNDNMTLEVEAGIERSQSESETLQDSMFRDFFFFGYIWQR